MTDLQITLQRLLGEGGVIGGEEALQRSVVWGQHTPCLARLIARPRNTAEVAAIVRECASRNQRIVVHGGLTGLVGGAVATQQEIAISLERMNAIEEVNRIDRTMVLGAGVPVEAAQEAADAEGLSLQIDFGARGSATIGGAIATNAGGNRVARYGMMREQVLGIEVVLANGEIVSSMHRLIKNNTGYDLKHLFIGSEGTLGIITRAVLRLRAMPLGTATALVAFADFSAILESFALLDSRMGGQVSAFELMWQDFYGAVTTPPASGRAPLPAHYLYYALVEVQAEETGHATERLLDALNFAIETGLVQDAVVAQSERERRSMWALRDDIETIFGLGAYISFDVSLPQSEMESYVKYVTDRLQREYPRVRPLFFGHLGDGNLHIVTISPTPYTFAEKKSVEAVVYAPLKDQGGSVSAEHGIGIDKLEYLSLSRSTAEIAMMQTLKTALDPQNLLNHGKLVPLNPPAG